MKLQDLITVAFLLVVVGLIVYTVYTLITDGRKTDRALAAYNARRNAFTATLSDRAKTITAAWRGASQTEIIMTLEQRIYELEQRLMAHERLNVDDGK